MARSAEVNKYLSNEGRGSRRPQAPYHPPLGLRITVPWSQPENSGA